MLVDYLSTNYWSVIRSNNSPTIVPLHPEDATNPKYRTITPTRNMTTRVPAVNSDPITAPSIEKNPNSTAIASPEIIGSDPPISAPFLVRA